MEATFLKKYKPQKYKDFAIGEDLLEFLNTLIEINTLNILLVGDTSCGKSSLLDATMREYYNSDIPLENVLYINNLQEQGISYYRNEVKTFCQTPSFISGKKKFIILDDIDTMNEQSQQVFRNCIDKYSHIVNFIASCTNTQKVVESIQSRCTIIKIKPMGKDFFKKVINNIKSNENIEITQQAEDFILNISNNSIRILINYMEKFKLYNNKISLDVAKTICTNISFSEFEKYTKAWKNGSMKEASLIIKNIFDKGYSVMDILDCYYTFIKFTDILNEYDKYNAIIIICSYISRFYTKHEHEIELFFLTFDLYNMNS